MKHKAQPSGYSRKSFVTDNPRQPKPKVGGVPKIKAGDRPYDGVRTTPGKSTNASK